MPAKNGGTVATSESLWRHWRRLERRLADLPRGRVLDATPEGARIDEQSLEDIHRRKTGELIRASIAMPGLLADATDDIAKELDEFGSDIGLVFQIRDDLLEVEQDTATLGKSAASDVEKEKATYPSILGVQGAEDRAAELYARAMRRLESLGPQSDGLRWVSDYIIKRSN